MADKDSWWKDDTKDSIDDDFGTRSTQSNANDVEKGSKKGHANDFGTRLILNDVNDFGTRSVIEKSLPKTYRVTKNINKQQDK